MSRLEFVDTVSEDFFDVIVEVGFEEFLSIRDTVEVLQILLDVIKSKTAHGLFEGLVHLEINNEILSVRFRFVKSDGDSTDSGDEESENLSRQKVQFIFYLFAKIDRQHRLGDIPFPPSFRAFEDLTLYLK